MLFTAFSPKSYYIRLIGSDNSTQAEDISTHNNLVKNIACFMFQSIIIMKILIRALILQCTLVIVAGLDSKDETDSSFHTTAVQLHNEYRGKHGAKPLKNSEDLNKRAKRCAEYYLSKMLFDMSCPFKGSTGENLYAIGGGGRNSSLTSASLTQRAIENWYSKSSNYNFENTNVQPKSGQFTQLVWGESRELGFGVEIRNDIAVAVALYSPPGNVLGHFATNVGSLD